MPASKAAKERHRREKLIRSTIRRELISANLLPPAAAPGPVADLRQSMASLRRRLAFAAAVVVTAPPVIVFLLWLFGA